MVDVRGFVTPEQDFRGLNSLAEGVRYETQRDEEKARREAVRKSGNSAFLQDMLDPKYLMSGTVFDPNINQGINDLMQKGIELSQTEGMDNAALQMALMPAYRRLSDYSQKAKTIRADVEGRLKDLPKGYNKSKLLQEALNAAFVGEDGNALPLEKIDQVDVEKDYIAEAVRRNPLGVTTGDIFADAIKDFGVFSGTKQVVRQSATGAKQKRLSAIEHRAVFDYDEETQQWVPKYEIAKDGDKPQMGTFTNEKGQKVQAPIRMVTDEIYNKMVTGYPAIADRIRGELMQINPNIDPNGAEAKRLAKMLMYEELKPLATGTIKDIQENKAAPAPRINVNVGGGRGDNTNVNDIYSRIDDNVQSNLNKGFTFTRFNSLKADEQSVVMDFVNKSKAKDEDLSVENLVLSKDQDGNIEVYKSNVLESFNQSKKKDPQYLITTLPKVGTNLKVQPGAAEKRKVIGGGQANKPKDPLGIL